MANDVQDKIASTWNYSEPAASETAFLTLQENYSEDSEEWWLVQTQIARTYSLRREFPTADSLLDEIHSQLEEHGKELTVRYCLERGRSYNSQSEREKACPLFLQAFETAEAHALENLAIDAAHMLGIASSPDEQLRWNLKTIAMIERSEDKRVKNWLPSLYNNTGWTYFDKEQYDEAMRLFQLSLAWHSERNTGQGHRIALWCVARCHRAMGDYEKALQMQEDILERSAKEGADPSGYTHEELAELYAHFKKTDESCEHASIAHAALSKDAWFVANETARLERLQALSEACK